MKLQGVFYLYHPPKSLSKKCGTYDFIKSKISYIFFNEPVKKIKIVKGFERIYNLDKDVCCYFSDKKSDNTIVYFHGNASTALDEIWCGCTQMQTKLNVNLVVIEYPGYGERCGISSKDTILNDLTNTWKILTNKIGKRNNVFLYGISLGAAVALHTKPREYDYLNIRGVILHNPFSSIGAMVDKFCDNKWIRWGAKFLCTEDWDNEREINQITVPCLIICGTMDQLIPMAQKQTLYMKCRTDCELLKYVGGHNDLFDDDTWEKIKYWINTKSYFKI